MNNDAKDVIGRLRAINVLLVLLHLDGFAFPLDVAMKAVLSKIRPHLLRVIDLVSELTRFGQLASELQSSIDDILDPDSSTYYTRDYVDMLLSLYRGSEDSVRLNYEDKASVQAALIEVCLANVGALFQSIMWVRIAFYSCYPDAPFWRCPWAGLRSAVRLLC